MEKTKKKSWRSEEDFSTSACLPAKAGRSDKMDGGLNDK